MPFIGSSHESKSSALKQKRTRIGFVLLFIVSTISACREDNLPGNSSRNRSERVVISGNGQDFSPSGDDRELTAAQNEHRENYELTATVRVEKILPDDRQGLQHQRFLVALSNGSTVLIANDLQYGERVPVSEGDLIRVRGEYIWNERGGVMHWTHRSDEPRHQGGWIELNGHRYQ